MKPVSEFYGRNNGRVDTLPLPKYSTINSSSRVYVQLHKQSRPTLSKKSHVEYFNFYVLFNQNECHLPSVNDAFS